MPPMTQCMAARKAVSFMATMIITVSCRSMCSAAINCWSAISGPRTSTGPSMPGRSWPSWSSGCAGPGRRLASSCAPTAVSAVIACYRGASAGMLAIWSAWPGMPGSMSRLPCENFLKRHRAQCRSIAGEKPVLAIALKPRLAVRIRRVALANPESLGYRRRIINLWHQ